MTDIGKLILVIAIIASIWLFTKLSPILVPFFVAALLAYLGDPLVDKLEKRKLSRIFSVIIVFSGFFILGLLALLVLLPILGTQLTGLIKRIPDYISYIQSIILPWLDDAGLSADLFNLEMMKQFFRDYWLQMGKAAGGVFGGVGGELSFLH